MQAVRRDIGNAGQRREIFSINGGGMQMKRINSVVFVGLGAVGSAFFAKVCDNISPDAASAVAYGERALRYAENGLKHNGKHYSVRVAEAGSAPAELLFISVKNTQLDNAVRDAASFVGPDTVIIAPLNGVTSERVLMERFGSEKVLYSYAMIDAERQDDGFVSKGTECITFGCAENIPGRYTENVSAVEYFFRRAGINYEIPNDMLKKLWRKFMMNCGVNQVSASLGFTYGMMNRSWTAGSLVRASMEEAASVARAEGVPLGDDEIYECYRALINTVAPSGKTSMLQDIEAGRMTEVDAFAGTVVALAKKHSIETPVNYMFLKIIRAKEEIFALGKTAQRG